jgi:hypothetical protein
MPKKARGYEKPETGKNGCSTKRSGAEITWWRSERTTVWCRCWKTCKKPAPTRVVLHPGDLQERIEKALEPFSFPKPTVARITGSDVYFVPGGYDKLQRDATAMNAVLDAIKAAAGVAEVYRAEQLADRPGTHSPLRQAMADGYFSGRSGDLFVVPKPYWLMDGTPSGKTHSYGTGHGTPYNYDQRVPILLMAYGIQPGEYHGEVTPADIAPTLASLCGITLAPRGGHALAAALAKASASHRIRKAPTSAGAEAPKR